MSSRSQLVWQRSPSQLCMVYMSLPCTFPTMRKICPKLVKKSMKSMVVTWVPFTYPSLRRFPHQNHKVTSIAVDHCDPHSPDGFAPATLVFTLSKLFTSSCIYRIYCRGLPPRRTQRHVHQAWGHLPGQGKNCDTLPAPQRSGTRRMAESSRDIRSASPALGPWIPHHAFRGG